MGMGASIPTRTLEKDVAIDVYIEIPTKCLGYKTVRKTDYDSEYSRERTYTKCIRSKVIADTYKVFGKPIGTSGIEGSEVSVPWAEQELLTYTKDEIGDAFQNLETKQDPLAGHEYYILTIKGQKIRLESIDRKDLLSTKNSWSYNKSRDHLLEHAREAGLQVPARANQDAGSGFVRPTNDEVLDYLVKWEVAKMNGSDRIIDPLTNKAIKVGGNKYKITEDLIANYLSTARL